MFRRSSLVLAACALVAIPAGALADGSTTTTTPPAAKAHVLLRAAANFDGKVVKLTAQADALQVAAGKLRVEAAATTPADQTKLDQAAKLDARAAKFDAAAVTFAAKATAFRTKAATRLAKVDDTTTAAASATKAKGLLNAAKQLRANAAKKTAAAAALRTEANASTPVDQAGLDQAAALDAAAAKLIATAIVLEGKAAIHAAKAEAKAAAAA
ncbi:MAG: hypothetical protein JWM86_2122 [Thermoleophilia bacterium]|nr:hypothetical protein [Thermoleophilia bacterium]